MDLYSIIKDFQELFTLFSKAISQMNGTQITLFFVITIVGIVFYYSLKEHHRHKESIKKDELELLKRKTLSEK
jgi:hypothetical protein